MWIAAILVVWLVGRTELDIENINFCTSDPDDGVFDFESHSSFFTDIIDSGMSNADYYLDSPLNADFVEGVLNYIRTKVYPAHHRT